MLLEHDVKCDKHLDFGAIRIPLTFLGVIEIKNASWFTVLLIRKTILLAVSNKSAWAE